MADTPIITGVDATIRTIGRATRAIKKSLPAALLEAARVAYRKADYYVPKDTEALRRSGGVEIDGDGFGVRVRLVYGGPDAPYALYVHEDLTAFHEPPTCAKWIERAIRESRGTMAHVCGSKLQVDYRKSMDMSGE